MSPERRQALSDQWANEEPLPRGSMKYSARAIRRWAQGDRDRVINLGLDLEGGVHILYELDFPPDMKDEEQRKTAVIGAVEIIRNRVDQLGIREPIVQREGERRIVVQLPGVKDAARAKDLAGKPAQLRFHIVEGRDATRKALDGIDRALNGKLWPRLKSAYRGDLLLAEEDMDVVQQLLEQQRALWPQGYMFAFGTSPPALDRNRVVGLFLMKEKEEMTGETLINAHASVDTEKAGQGFQINLQFNAVGAARFGDVTTDHVGELLGAVIDGRVKEAAQIREPIRGGSARITGSFTLEEAQDLAIALRSGAIPVPIKPIEERVVGPTLGVESIRQGLRAGLIGAAFVFVFMILYYRLAGVLANIALALNILMIMAGLACLRATLTLPGIAGIVLTIGMAVDANVLIYERIREELRRGKTIRAAIEAGYTRAFLTIIDSNLTTLVAALVLFQFGTGPVKGFAVTLTIGLFSSVFTAVVVTRMVFDLLIKRRTFRTLTMMSFIKESHIPFISWRRYAYAISIGVILVGMGFFIWRGDKNFGIDFRPGTIVQVRFSGDATTGQVRNALAGVGLGDAVVQSVEGTRDILIRTSEAKAGGAQAGTGMPTSMSDKIMQALRADPSIPSFTIEKNEYVGPTVGSELAKDAFWALLIAFVGIAIYVSVRFEWKFALAANIALVHDVLVAVGCLAMPFLGKREISLPVVAALLTIVGYSVNDTIVIFDRVRENLRTMRGKKYSEIIDMSINQTLARTFLTSLTTFTVVLALFVLGGPVLRDFSFVMLAGIISGVYSTVFVAAPLQITWQRKSSKRA